MNAGVQIKLWDSMRTRTIYLSAFHDEALYTNPRLLFSERELMFMFAICRRASVCLSSVVCRLSVCLSVVCNGGAPYSGY